MASTPRLAAGTLFAGDYRILGPLAEGGMGSVYRAEQQSTRKIRALKVVHGRLLDDERSRARFVREATIGASIASEHVVEVIGAGIDAATELPYLAMELLEGGDLAAVLRHRGRLAASELGALLRQLCHGLGAAHVAKVVHRDLKPENVFVAHPLHAGAAFTVKILDFGIAKVVQESRTVATLTGTVGSPLWMSPEQINNEALAPSTDVWALGLLAFWTLTGQSYWRTSRAERLTVQALFAEQLFRPLESASQRAAEFGMAGEIPPGFDDWFAHCVARQGSDRFSDANAAWTAFAQAVDDGMRSDIALLPATMEGSTGSIRLSIVAETFDDAAAARSGDEPSLGTTALGDATRTLASDTRLGAVAPAPAPRAAEATVAAPARSRAWLAAPILVVAAALTTWLLWPTPEPEPSVIADAPANEPPPHEPPARDPPPEDPPARDPLPHDHIAADPGEPRALVPVRPMVTQPSFSAARLEFLGWTADGTRFVLDATYPDRAGLDDPNNLLRLVEIHDALTGAMLESYALARDAAPEIGERDRLARAAAEAEPGSEWPEVRELLALVPGTVATTPGDRRFRIDARVDPIPSGTTLTIDATEHGHRYAWELGEIADAEALPIPHLELHWIAGEERWQLLDVPLPLAASELRALVVPQATVRYEGELTHHIAPDGQRIVVLVRGALAGAPEDARAIDARWFLRAAGPQIRLVDGGAGQRRLRRAAQTLAGGRLPIAAVDLDHETVQTSRIYVRARDREAARLAARINASLGTALPSALLQSGGWTQAVVVLGADLP